MTAPLILAAMLTAGDPLPPGATARLGSTRWWQPSAVRFAAFLPGGRLFIGGQDGQFCVWDDDGRVALIHAPTGYIYSNGDTTAGGIRHDPH